MKNIESLSVDISEFGDRVIENLKKAQRKTAESVYQDVINLAPYKTGAYVDSIKISDTEYDGYHIRTSIYTDATVKAKYGGEYNLGYLLETGTFPHAIPNAWGKGYTVGYVGTDGKYHKGTMDADWHPGTVAQPHFIPALQKNIALYHSNIQEAIKEAK